VTSGRRPTNRRHVHNRHRRAAAGKRARLILDLGQQISPQAAQGKLLRSPLAKFIAGRPAVNHARSRSSSTRRRLHSIPQRQHPTANIGHRVSHRLVSPEEEQRRDVCVCRRFPSAREPIVATTGVLINLDATAANRREQFYRHPDRLRGQRAVTESFAVTVAGEPLAGIQNWKRRTSAAT